MACAKSLGWGSWGTFEEWQGGQCAWHTQCGENVARDEALATARGQTVRAHRSFIFYLHPPNQRLMSVFSMVSFWLTQISFGRGCREEIRREWKWEWDEVLSSCSGRDDGSCEDCGGNKHVLSSHCMADTMLHALHTLSGTCLEDYGALSKDVHISLSLQSHCSKEARGSSKMWVHILEPILWP